MAARLEPLYRGAFTTPESWTVEVAGAGGTEGQSFLIAEGRAEGRPSARLRAANYPRRRVDGVLTPDFRGVLETDDGATVLFAWHGLTRVDPETGISRIVGSVTHVTDDPRYLFLNDSVCALTGQVHARPEGGFEVVLEIEQIHWQPLTTKG